LTVTSIESASVYLPLPARATPEDTAATCTSQSGIIKQCELYATTQPVQDAVADMDAAVADLQVDLAKLHQLHAEISIVEGLRDRKVVVVRLKHGAVETAINTASNGDAQVAAKWVGQTRTRAKPVPVSATTDPPESPAVRNIKRSPGSVEVSCAEEPGATCYLFQQGTDPLHPETWPSPVTLPGHTHKVRNLPVGQVVCFRIAVVRRGSVQSDWTPVFQITVR
jgi:hypothetical protein